MRTFLPLLMLCGLLLATACGHSDAYKNTRYDDKKLGTDAYNCRWDLTHEADGKGGYVAKEVDEATLQTQVKACLEAKGYDLSAPKQKDDDGSWWWPF